MNYTDYICGISEESMHNDACLSCLFAGPLFFWIILKMGLYVSHGKTNRIMRTLTSKYTDKVKILR